MPVRRKTQFKPGKDFKDALHMPRDETQMSAVLYDFLLVALSALISWFITHRYYKKSLRDQDAQHATEKTALVEAIRDHNATDATLLMQQYIDAAVDAWKKIGTPKHYLDSLSDLPEEEKAKIFRAASLRHKGREPKDNPYTP